MARSVQRDVHAAPETRCDREPIHAPGSVQSHGALLAFDPADGRITHWSENIAEVLRLECEPENQLVRDVLGAAVLEEIEVFDLEDKPADMPALTVVLPSGDSIFVTIHRIDRRTVLELERSDEATHDVRRKLLRELRLAIWHLEATTDVREACAVAAVELRALSGYDRVMVYRFHDDEHGEVIAEALADGLEPYLGLHYPSSDIPRPARRLLRLSPTRVIADVDAPPVPIASAGTERHSSLDLSRSLLRAVSPIHLQYLRNMGVAATLTLSLSDGPRLWGLLACHHRTARCPSPTIRVACEVLARATWLRIDAHEQQQEHEHKAELQANLVRLAAGLSSVVALAPALAGNRRAVLDMLGADGVHVRIDGIVSDLGAAPPAQDLVDLLRWLREASPGAPYVTDTLGAILPDRAQGAIPAGVLAIPITDDWDERIIWFRREQSHAVTWAGNPAKATGGDDGDERRPLTPRASFAAWTETVRGRSLPWTSPEIDAAMALAQALPDVRRARARDVLAGLALRDTLTGLPNRALLLDRAEVALHDLTRTGRGLSILFLDLDGFKQVNDTFGHEAGDALLIEVARRLREGVRGVDTVARLGGDEFVILCPADETREATAWVEHLAQRLLAALALPIRIGDRSCTVTTSIGIATASDGESPSEAIAVADAAMYRAKRAGKNRISR
jgi:diguanylate cyclase (GGDEF)-like protein